MRRIRPLRRTLPPVVALGALVVGLLAPALASAETRSVVLVLENADLTPGPVETESSVLAGTPDLSTASWLTSSVQDPRQSFTAVGSHWMDAPGTQLQLRVSPDGVHWGRWITDHTATVEDWAATTWEECAARVRAIQTYHIDTQGWNDIGYAYVVCKHGDIFQAREDDDDTTDVQGAHDGFNKGSTGISALGYFHPPVDHQPTEAQLSAIVQLTAWIASRRGIDPLGQSLYEAFGAPVDNVYGHRDVSATACPGDNLYARMEAIRAAVSELVLRQLL